MRIHQGHVRPFQNALEIRIRPGRSADIVQGVPAFAHHLLEHIAQTEHIRVRAAGFTDTANGDIYGITLLMRLRAVPEPSGMLLLGALICLAGTHRKLGKR